MGTSKLTSKGQVTIPSEVREHLAVETGDSIEFVVLENGTVVVRPAYIDIMDLAACLSGTKRKRLSIAQMQKVIQVRAAKSHARR